MNTILVPKHKISRMFMSILSLLVIVAMALPVTAVAHAAQDSQFVGKWEAVDLDGSAMSLAIGGPSSGPFRITWTDKFISFCDGKAGILRGTGWLNEDDPNLLESDVTLECFTTGATLNFHDTFRYHPTTNTLSIWYSSGQVTIWHRPGGNQVLPPEFHLRVMYGDNWAESFYEGGHTVWLTVTEADGVTVKATAEVTTGPREEWGGETGFQTRPEDWVPAQPDIQPNDWVFGWVDNGASAQVQIGEISGKVDLNADSITGTVNAPWFADQQVEVECHSWGAPLPEEIIKYEWAVPDDEDQYTCSWAGEWDVQPYQTIGVGYTGPDGHWVANSVVPPDPHITGSEMGDFLWVTGFYPGLLDIFIYESSEDGADLLWSGQQEAVDLWGITFVGSDVHGLALMPGNTLVVSDGVNEKSLILETVTLEIFDTENEIMAGKAPRGSEVWAMAGPLDWQQPLVVQADPDTGVWWADFKTLPEPFDITEDMRDGSYARIYDADGDTNESTSAWYPLPVILGWLDWEVIEGLGWIIGDTVTLTIGDFSRQASVAASSWDPSYGYVRFELGPEDYDLKIGDFVSMTNGVITKEILVPALAVTDYDLGGDTVSGTYDPELGFWIGVNGMEPVDVQFEENTWIATFPDLGPNMWGDVIQTDADGDDVRATIHTPNPNFYAVPDENKIFAQEWIAGFPLELKIYDAADVEVYSASMMVDPPSEVPWTLAIFDTGSFDLLPEQRIMLSQRGYERELVVHHLQVTDINLDTKTISGIADPGWMFIGVNGTDTWVEVGAEGGWAVTSPDYDS